MNEKKFQLNFQVPNFPHILGLKMELQEVNNQTVGNKFFNFKHLTPSFFFSRTKIWKAGQDRRNKSLLLTWGLKVLLEHLFRYLLNRSSMADGTNEILGLPEKKYINTLLIRYTNPPTMKWYWYSPNSYTRVTAHRINISSSLPITITFNNILKILIKLEFE